MSRSMAREVSHYVATAHPPGGVLQTVKCNFLSKDTENVVIAKSRRLEVRQLRQNEEDAASPFPIIFHCSINGRITGMVPLPLPSHHSTDLLFLTTDQYEYAVIGYRDKGVMATFSSGSLRDAWCVLGTLSECGPLVAVDPHMRCIALHMYDGLVTVFPILAPSASRTSKVLGDPFHARLEERSVLAVCMLHHLDPSQPFPHLSLLHQDSRGAQHVVTHAIDLQRTQLWNLSSAAGQTNIKGEWLKKSRLDGGSSILIPVPPLVSPVAAAAGAPTLTTSNLSGGVVVLGQRQITYCSVNSYKVMPIPPGMILSWDALPSDDSGMPRFLLGDEFGNLHVLTLLTHSAMTAQDQGSNKVIALQLDTLGSCTLANSLQYLEEGLVFCGSILGDSQLVQIHDEPIQVEEEEELGETTYLSVIEEYTHLGPIMDFDLVPMAGTGEQSQVVTASGTSKSGSLRIIRNGIGMKEYASVELSGIQSMWSLRKNFEDKEHTYLVQSYVGETRVLGVAVVEAMDEIEPVKDAMEEDSTRDDEVAGTLEEVVLPGIDSNASTLHIANIVGNLFLQITETSVRLFNITGDVLDSFQPESAITVATTNEAGQTLVAIQGGVILYLEIKGSKIHQIGSKQMDTEVSCLDLHPFSKDVTDIMQDGPLKADFCAVGLWDDFTVRILSLSSTLQEVLQIDLSTEDDSDRNENDGRKRGNRDNMMARSLSLVTLDFASSSMNGTNKNTKTNSLRGVDMLFIGLGDGTLVSFAISQGDSRLSIRSRKEVNLGTQRINLIPLTNEKGGQCILASGDRPTVIYLTGSSTSQNHNPKLCYSNVNLSPSDDADHNDVSRPHVHESMTINHATPFFSPLLFETTGQDHYSLCIADDSNLTLGVIDDIQKLHVTTCRLGMAPRRVVHFPEGHMFVVGCIESGIKQVGMGGGESNMGNCIRFLDDVTFDDVHRIDLEPCEIIGAIISASMFVQKPDASASVGVGSTESNKEYKQVLIVGTAYALHDEDEPTKGRIMVFSCQTDGDTASRKIEKLTELQVRGGVYSMCQFYEGKILITVNSKTQMCQLVDEGNGSFKLSTVGIGHHGHILSLVVASRATKATTVGISDSESSSVGPGLTNGSVKPKDSKHELAIVGDLMRSISLVQHYPEHNTLEEIARDFNANWTTAVSMLTDDIYIGGENWNNLYVLRRNVKASSEEVRCRLDTVGEFHLGEMVNKFKSGSLVMPTGGDGSIGASSSKNRAFRRSLASPKKSDSGKIPASPRGATASKTKRPMITIGSQTLFGTTDGTLGCILGLDGITTAFFTCLERALEKVIEPVGRFSHAKFRAFNAEKRNHPSHGFVDGDLIESFLDLDSVTMEKVVSEMNRDGNWIIDDSSFAANGNKDETLEDNSRPELAIDDVLALVEEMTMLH